MSNRLSDPQPCPILGSGSAWLGSQPANVSLTRIELSTVATTHATDHTNHHKPRNATNQPSRLDSRLPHQLISRTTLPVAPRPAIDSSAAAAFSRAKCAPTIGRIVPSAISPSIAAPTSDA
jgi:hypothetical protein